MSKSNSRKESYKDYYSHINPSLSLPRRTAYYRKQNRKELNSSLNYFDDPNVNFNILIF